jgi:Helicase conserved C-terminal domain
MKELLGDGFAGAMIHGDRSQPQRKAALNGFHEGRFQVLVATDIASLRRAQNGGGLYPPTRPDGQSWAPRARLDLDGRTEVLELRRIERTLKLKMERLDNGGAAEPNDSKHASLANSDRFAGRSVWLESLVLLSGRQAPATCQRSVEIGNHALFRKSFATEPSFRIFFRARFRAKACFTRRLSPGFR